MSPSWSKAAIWGVTTDADGRRTQRRKNGTVLAFSFIGMEPAKATVTGPTLHISMKESAIAVEEVVAIGYSTVRQGRTYEFRHPGRRFRFQRWRYDQPHQPDQRQSPRPDDPQYGGYGIPMRLPKYSSAA
ncbi:MAG: hypothetical protein ACLSGF_10380 [Alistipes onderdonkii]